MPGVGLHLEFYDVTTLARRPAAPVATSESDGAFVFEGLVAHDYVLQAELPHEIVTYNSGFDAIDDRESAHITLSEESSAGR